jgi:hypothetical protein
MNEDEAVELYRSLPEADQIRLLSIWAHELTVHARGTCVAGSEDVRDPRRLRVFNEAEHKVTAHLRDLIMNEAQRYPDEVFARTLWAFAEALDIQKYLATLLKQLSKQDRILTRS